MQQYMRRLPPIHQFQHDNRFRLFMSKHQLDQKRLTALIQEQLEQIRTSLMNDDSNWKFDSRSEYTDFIFNQVDDLCKQLTNPFLRRVINATGTILHTNLGRARLSEAALSHVIEVAQNYSNLEYNLAQGVRGSRHDIVEDLLKQLTGAESAMVVNNNAAAVYLILRTFASDKEVIVSRGQLVEIGGSFRISAIMEESGARLVEVGTTNKTHLFDYEDAISDNTRLILKVHTSNFKTIGFTKFVPTEELAKLTGEHEQILFYEDLGSGAFYDFEKLGIGEEPVVSDVLKKGVDLVSLSGDKLLGGPQAGIIVGKKEYVDVLKKHQLARVLRVDKMTLAALEATLKAYLQDENMMKDIPTIRDMTETLESIKIRAGKFLSLLQQHDVSYDALLDHDKSKVGGGTMPDVTLPTMVVMLTHPELTSEAIVTYLRTGTPSIVTRIKQNHVLFDFRTIRDDELDLIVKRLTEIERNRL